MKAPLLFLLSLVLAAGARAARLETSVEPREARVGDRVTLTVVLATAAAETPLPSAPPEDFGAFELLSASTGTSAHAFVLASFEVGTATIPALTFRYAGADGKPHALRTPPIYVPIKSVLTPADKDLSDIKGALKLPPDRSWLWVLLALAAGAAGALAWKRRRRPAGAGAPGAPAVPPDAAALEALEALEALMTGPSKPYYSRLTDVLKTYIEGRFGLPALDRTTEEMLPLLKKLPLAAEERMALRETLDVSDLAKFARLESPPEERRLHRDRVKVFVLSTKPRPAQEVPVP